MSIYLSEAEDIYFSKTKEYFREVLSSYSIGNYRSATVMLYSVAVCDMLFKLQELKDMFNDSIASEILQEIETSRNASGSKSKWEKELVDNIFNKTKLLDLEAYTNLNHLYDHRNFSAHPALNENYELIAPSKETTIANIKNILNNILIKPPIFITNVIDTLTEDLKGKGDLYIGATDKLAIYLKNKYYLKMLEPMKLTTIKALWKFCFCKPDIKDCVNNMWINRQALEVLIGVCKREALAYIKENNQVFSVATHKGCRYNLMLLLSKYPDIYAAINIDTQQQIDALMDEDVRARCLAWFKYKTPAEHIKELKDSRSVTYDEKVIHRMEKYYSDIGEMKALIDLFIWFYGESSSYDLADNGFKYTIEPFLDNMTAEQFEEIIKVTNNNRQIWDRGLAYSANNKLMRYAKKALNDDFDYSSYNHFKFDTSILQPIDEPEKQIESNDDWPF